MAVLTERQGAVLLCTLDRAGANNSITPEVFSGLLEAYREADRDDGIRAVVTRGAGPNFSVGADIADLSAWVGKPLKDCFREVYEGRQGLPGPGADAARALDTLGMNRWAEAVAGIRVPLIAQIRGVAAGGGLGLALLHHFRFADATARFTTAFGRLGLGSELGVSCLLQHTVGRQKALDMQLTNRLVAAEEAHAMGLVDRLLPPDELETATLAYAQEIAAAAPLAVRAAIDAHQSPRRAELRAALEREWQQQQALWGSEDFREGVAALAERRAPDFKGR